MNCVKNEANVKRGTLQTKETPGNCSFVAVHFSETTKREEQTRRVREREKSVGQNVFPQQSF